MNLVNVVKHLEIFYVLAVGWIEVYSVSQEKPLCYVKHLKSWTMARQSGPI